MSQESQHPDPLHRVQPELLDGSRRHSILISPEEEARISQILVWLQEVYPERRLSQSLAARIALAHGLRALREQPKVKERKKLFISPQMCLELLLAQSQTLLISTILDYGLCHLEEQMWAMEEIGQAEEMG